MSVIRASLAFIAVLFLSAACAAAPSSKIHVDLAGVNEQGLRGPPNGLRAVHYEYCIPAGGDHESAVRGIDPTAEFMRGSRGRIGCRAGEVLVTGNTQQPGYGKVLDGLASLPYINSIIETHFE